VTTLKGKRDYDQKKTMESKRETGGGECISHGGGERVVAWGKTNKKRTKPT